MGNHGSPNPSSRGNRGSLWLLLTIAVNPLLPCYNQPIQVRKTPRPKWCTLIRPELVHFESTGDMIGGFWEEQEEIARCCLLTTSANAVLEPIHNRMPVIIRRGDWDEWFSAGDLSDESFHRITAPYAPDEMSALAVSPLVNSARIDDARCIEPLAS